MMILIVLQLRPAFVNTLFPVTLPHCIYSAALVIIILIDNLKYIIIFVYVWFLPWKIPNSRSFQKLHLGVKLYIILLYML